MENKKAVEVFKEYSKVKWEGLSNIEAIREFFNLYEIGVYIGGEYKVRFPAQTDSLEGSVVLTTDVSEGSMVRIMSCSVDSSIKGAKEAAVKAKEKMGNKELARAIIFDCVCRRAIMKDKMKTVIDEIKNVLGNIPLI
jgi:hypothetical protein